MHHGAPAISLEQRGPVEARDPEGAGRIRRERERHHDEDEPAHAPGAGEEERDDHREREPDDHERPGGQRMAGQRQAVDQRPRQLQPRAVPGHDETRAKRGDRGGEDRHRQHSGKRLTAPLPEREEGDRGKHGPEVAELFGEVSAAELRGQVMQRRRPQGRHLRGDDQIGEIELVALAADAERITMRKCDPQVRRGDGERDEVRKGRQREAANDPARAAARV